MIAQLTQELSLSLEEKENLRGQLVDLNQEQETLKNTLSQLGGKNEELVGKLSDSQNRVQSLLETLSSSEVENKGLQGKIDDMKDQNLSLEGQISELENESSFKTENLNDALIKISLVRTRFNRSPISPNSILLFAISASLESSKLFKS